MINLKANRAKQARLAALLSQAWVLGVLVLVNITLLGLGALFILSQNELGWLLLGFAAWPAMILVWHRRWLKVLPPLKNGVVVEDVLDGVILGQLRTVSPSPAQLAEIVMKHSGGLFFAVRLGIGPNFLRELSSPDAAQSNAVWDGALQLQKQLGLSHISPAVLTTALVQTMNNRDQMLAQLQITFEDVVACARWYHHLHDLIASVQKRRLGGGIGRDLSFGFTPLLEQLAQNFSAQSGRAALARELEGHRQLIDTLFEQLGTGGRQNAVLVGPAGAGKTTLVRTFAERLLREDAPAPPELRYRQVMALDPNTLIANAPRRGELEALLTRIFNEAYGAKNIILFLDNAELFFSNETGAVDMRNVLLPVLENGAIRLILSMDEQQWLKLSRATPALAQQLNRINVPPLNEAESLLVCEDAILTLEFRNKVTYMYQALKTAYRLGQRYVGDQAMPGQAVSLLEAAAHFSTNKLVTSASVEQAVEQTYGVRVATARKGDESAMLLNLEDLLHQHMINQKHAVSAVANALRRARSGVRNQNRPIGSFLFLGPTGVGKSELAKALARVYFGGEDRLVRIDLNEFGQGSDVNRLIADGASDPYSLTAQILKQPFSVVLFDEIEKAHPNVLNTLLQLLDEGILRDVNNRAVSFRDAVVIATSNAGADRVRQYIDAGQQPEQFEQTFVNELIDSNQFKPEFLNRFDEIIVFRPLKQDELLQVVDLLLEGVNKTLANQKISVHLNDDAKQHLVQVGYDPRLGARPLRRVVQRTVENIVAKRLLQGEVAPGTVFTIPLTEIEQALQQ